MGASDDPAVIRLDRQSRHPDDICGDAAEIAAAWALDASQSGWIGGIYSNGSACPISGTGAWIIAS